MLEKTKCPTYLFIDEETDIKKKAKWTVLSLQPSSDGQN